MTQRSETAQRFRVEFAPIELRAEDVWPDGGAPEHPTCEDVAARMRNYGTPLRVIADWNLISNATVDGFHVW